MKVGDKVSIRGNKHKVVVRALGDKVNVSFVGSPKVNWDVDYFDVLEPKSKKESFETSTIRSFSHTPKQIEILKELGLTRLIRK